MLPIAIQYHALVQCQQVGNEACDRWCHWEESAREVTALMNAPVHRRVNAVVVTGSEVQHRVIKTLDEPSVHETS